MKTAYVVLALILGLQAIAQSPVKIARGGQGQAIAQTPVTPLEILHLKHVTLADGLKQGTFAEFFRAVPTCKQSVIKMVNIRASHLGKLAPLSIGYMEAEEECVQAYDAYCRSGAKYSSKVRDEYYQLWDAMDTEYEACCHGFNQ